MLKFIDGPAAGQALLLRRAPRFLRITHRPHRVRHDPKPMWDGLDQPGDTPEPDEILYAYETKKLDGRCHMRFGGNQKHRSGFYDVATYTFVPEQPDDATMRDNAKWSAWCEAQPPL